MKTKKAKKKDKKNRKLKRDTIWLLTMSGGDDNDENYPFTTEKKALRAAEDVLHDLMRTNSGVKCDHEIANRVHDSLQAGEVLEAMEIWNEYQNLDGQPDTELLLTEVELNPKLRSKDNIAPYHYDEPPTKATTPDTQSSDGPGSEEDQDHADPPEVD